MKYQAQLHCELEHEEIYDNLVNVATSTLADQEANPGEVTIVLTGVEEIQALNRRFADQDLPTDVLSFPDGTSDPETGRTYHGDIVIAVPIAQAQADDASHSLESELALLTLHGILHLLGYDHLQSDDRERMWAIQARILDRLGYEIHLPGEEP